MGEITSPAGKLAKKTSRIPGKGESGGPSPGSVEAYTVSPGRTTAHILLPHSPYACQPLVEDLCNQEYIGITAGHIGLNVSIQSMKTPVFTEYPNTPVVL